MSERFYLQVPNHDGSHTRTLMKDSEFQKLLDSISMRTLSQRHTHLGMIDDYAAIAAHPENQQALRANPQARKALTVNMNFVLEKEEQALAQGQPGHSTEAYAQAKRTVEQVVDALTPKVKLDLTTDSKGRLQATYTDASGKEHHAGKLWIRGGEMNLANAEIVLDGQTVKRAGTGVKSQGQQEQGVWSASPRNQAERLRVIRTEDDPTSPPGGGRSV